MTRAIEHHPDVATLMSFAAGALAEPLAAVIAAHASLCAACRREIETLELMGGVLLGDEKRAAAVRVPARPNEPKADGKRLVEKPTDPRLPLPIARRYDLAFESIKWRRLGPGVWHHRLPLSPGVAGDLRLLKIGGGCRMPEHGHDSTELTLVLDGAYADETGRYQRGDVQDVDQDVEHRPVAGTEGCVCLIASERPARFKTLIGKLMQPWTGM